MHPEVCPRGRCPLASLHREPHLGKDGRKVQTILIWYPEPNSTPPPPPLGGQLGGHATQNTMLPLTMVRERSVRKVNSALIIGVGVVFIGENHQENINKCMGCPYLVNNPSSDSIISQLFLNYSRGPLLYQW